MDETTQKNASMSRSPTPPVIAVEGTSQLASLVQQFQLEGRDNATLRRELRKVAPHAFAKAGAAPAARPDPVAARPRPPRRLSPRPPSPLRRRARRRPAPSGAEEWTEF